MTSKIEGVKTLLQRGYLRQTGTPMLFAAIVLLLSGIVLLGANVSVLGANSTLVQRTDDALIQISEVDAKLVGVEMAVRGYALTDDPSFLNYQQYERNHVTAAMDRLATLIAGEASQTSRFALLRVLVAKRLTLYTYLTDLGSGHAKEVADAITDPLKRHDMLSARLTLNALRDRELKLLAERQAVSAHQATRTYTLAIGIVVLAFVFAVLGLAFAQIGRGRAE
jgi:CHASE3 domain sensor protein